MYCIMLNLIKWLLYLMTMSVYHNYYKLSRLIRRPMQDFQVLNLLFMHRLGHQLFPVDKQACRVAEFCWGCLRTLCLSHKAYKIRSLETSTIKYVKDKKYIEEEVNNTYWFLGIDKCLTDLFLPSLKCHIWRKQVQQGPKRKPCSLTALKARVCWGGMKEGRA